MIDPTPSKDTAPTPARAVVCLLLNVIVFPGLGTLLSGDRSRRGIGMIQFGFGAGLIPVMVLMGMGMIHFSGADPAVVQAWLSNGMLVLLLWTVITSVLIFRDAWKVAKAREQAHARPGGAA